MYPLVRSDNWSKLFHLWIFYILDLSTGQDDVSEEILFYATVRNITALSQHPKNIYLDQKTTPDHHETSRIIIAQIHDNSSWKQRGATLHKTAVRCEQTQTFLVRNHNNLFLS